MKFSKGLVQNQEFWNKSDIPIFEKEDFQNVQVLMGNFTKVGRTFKQRCLRTYFLVKQFLLYSDVGSGNNIKGFVQLDIVFCQFNQLETGFQIALINNCYQVHLNTEDKQQFKTWVDALSNYCILSDFDQVYKLGIQIGQGSFSTVLKRYTINNVISLVWEQLYLLFLMDIIHLSKMIQNKPLKKIQMDISKYLHPNIQNHWRILSVK